MNTPNLLNNHRSHFRRRNGRDCRATLEVMEPRRLLSTVVVNTLLDESVANATTSLREAIAVAASGDTVQFQPGLSGTITLAGSELVVNKNLAISGPGAKVLAISGNDISRMVSIMPAATVTISGLTLRNGGGVDGGGAILNQGWLTVTNCVFTENTARGRDGCAESDQDGWAMGGAIKSYGPLQLTNTTFSKNRAVGGNGRNESPVAPGAPARGGAICAYGPMTMSGGGFSFNYAIGGTGGANVWQTSWGGDGNGGAIYSGDHPLLTAVSFESNVAFGGPGGYDPSTIEAGTQIGGVGRGGAICAGDDSVAIISRCTFTNNIAEGGLSQGSGLGGACFSSRAIRVTESSFVRNHAYGGNQAGSGWGGGEANGGAIMAWDANITQSTFAENTAIGGRGQSAARTEAGVGGEARGGALAVDGLVMGCTLFGNIAQGGRGGNGGYSDIGTPVPAGNGATAAGGAIDGTVELCACTIAGNMASGGARGEPVQGVANTALDGASCGGGIRQLYAAAIRNTLIATNTADIGPDVSGAVTSSGFNLIGKSNGSSGWITSDKTGTVTSPLNPVLGPLASNGGPTRTMMLLEGSPALDAGKSFGLTTDQRGSKRPVNLSAVPNAPGGDGSDIGAVERQALTPTQTPFKTFVIGATPLTLQVEDFDNGGEGIAYHDLDTANLGSAYRPTGVDLQATTDTGGGFNVGWAKAGEWLEYTVEMQKAGAYDLAFRVASNGAGGKLHLEVDGNDVTGQLAVPNTYGWQKWKTITKSGVNLTAGRHILRLSLDSNGATGSVGNFNHVTFTPAATAPVTLTTDTAAFVRDGKYRWTNYGSSPVLEVKHSTTNFFRESYLRFDLSSVASISSAKLRMYGWLDNPDGLIGVRVSAAGNEWSEGMLTWLTRPAAGVKVGEIAVVGANPQWYEADLTAFMQAEKLAGRNLVSLKLDVEWVNADHVLVSFASDEAVNGPEVVIQQ